MGTKQTAFASLSMQKKNRDAILAVFMRNESSGNYLISQPMKFNSCFGFNLKVPTFYLVGFNRFANLFVRTLSELWLTFLPWIWFFRFFTPFFAVYRWIITIHCLGLSCFSLYSYKIGRQKISPDLFDLSFNHVKKTRFQKNLTNATVYYTVCSIKCLINC